MSADTRPPISISLDLDNLWSYMKTHGDPGWESYPSYLEQLVEIVLDRLNRHGLTVTFFVVGQDAALERNRHALAALGQSGHEIGNHSFKHEPWLHLYEDQDLADEISRAEEVIEKATGQRPRGFRGPGFSLSSEVLRVLSRRGYDYDASTFPTFLGPLARAYYFWQSRGLSAEEREQRSKLFGTMAEGLRPIKPYLWHAEGRHLVEIPVTTMPVFRLPMHLSYQVYLASYARALAKGYMAAANLMCRAAGVGPSLLLHPLDFLGGDRVKELAFFPGMNLDTAFKLDFFDEVMEHLRARFRPVTMAQHARKIRESGAPVKQAGEADR